MVPNLADEEIVKKLEMKEKDVRKQELNDIRTVLSNASGRRFLWRVLNRCNSFSTIFSADLSTMSYNSGQQDLGHYLMAEVTEADENLLFKLMKDNRKER